MAALHDNVFTKKSCKHLSIMIKSVFVSKLIVACTKSRRYEHRKRSTEVSKKSPSVKNNVPTVCICVFVNTLSV